MNRNRHVFALTLSLLFIAISCQPQTPTPAANARPNILWVVWDTVRADRLSLYGHNKPTTPKLIEWARSACVFDDCVSAGSSTVTSHASMFTGLLPSEHGANNSHNWLGESYVTIAELLRDAGYQTYLFSANPHIAREENFHQGFQREQHPWDPAFKSDALRIIRAKLNADDRSSELAQRLNDPEVKSWSIKACGELAGRGLEAFLDQRDRSKPWFALLNYMEAHRPFIPALKYRVKMLPPALVKRTYEIDRSWLPMWRYTFGLSEYSPEELDIMAATYDACIAELDDLFADLLANLRKRGDLENTIVILVADHGEHLGEHHLLDHQFSLYNPLIHVPLVVFDPARFPPGREKRPVMSMDLFPTLLEIAGVSPPPAQAGRAVSLLAPQADRARISEYPSAFIEAIGTVKNNNPDWNPSAWMRSLRAIYSGDHKFIEGSDGRTELFDMRTDYAEKDNLSNKHPERVKQLKTVLAEKVRAFSAPAPRQAQRNPRSAAHIQRLKGLGYLSEDGAPPATATAPASRTGP